MAKWQMNEEKSCGMTVDMLFLVEKKKICENVETKQDSSRKQIWFS